MDNRCSLLFQKEGGEVVDSFSAWGIVCLKVPFDAGGKVKELPKRDWSDEDGYDVFVPSKLSFEGYESEFELAYKGQELSTSPFNLSLAFSRIDAFKKWLSGHDSSSPSASLSIYSPYSDIGRRDCYLSSISDESPHLQLKGENGNVYNETVVTFKVKFWVNDPVTNIVLG